MAEGHGLRHHLQEWPMTGTTWDLTRLERLTLSHPWFTSPHSDGVDTEPTDWDTSGPDGSEDCFALFGYIPVRFAQSDDERYVNRLVLDFKEGNPVAIATVAGIAATKIFNLDPGTHITEEILDMPGFLPYGAAIAVPSSKIGVGSTGINLLIETLTSPHGLPRWEKVNAVVAGDEIFRRHTALETPSHKVKKVMSDHLQTIRLEKKTGVRLMKPSMTDRYVIFDDVYTRGETFGACKALIREAHPRAKVRGFFVARTWARNT